MGDWLGVDFDGWEQEFYKVRGEGEKILDHGYRNHATRIFWNMSISP